MFENWKQKALVFALYSLIIVSIFAIVYALSDFISVKGPLYLLEDSFAVFSITFIFLAVTHLVLGYLRGIFKITLASRYIAFILAWIALIVWFVSLQYWSAAGAKLLNSKPHSFSPEIIVPASFIAAIGMLVIYIACDGAVAMLSAHAHVRKRKPVAVREKY